MPELPYSLGDQDEILLQFGGQGSSYLPEMIRLYRNYPELGEFFKALFKTIDDGIEYLQPQKLGLLKEGLPLQKWLEGEITPDTTYLAHCPVALTCIHACQSAYYHLLTLNGYPPAVFLPKLSAMTGHSMGLHSALLASLGLEGEDYFTALRKFVLFVLIGGSRCQQAFGLHQPNDKTIDGAKEFDNQYPTSMVAVSGLTVDELQTALDQVNEKVGAQKAITITLINKKRSLVISGFEEDLNQLRQTFYHQWQEREINWQYLEVSAPFHSHLLDPAWPTFKIDNLFIDFRFKGAELQVPVFATDDGRIIGKNEDLYETSFKMMTARTLNWPVCIGSIAKNSKINRVIDCGPGTIAAHLSHRILGESVIVHTLAKRSQLKEFLGTSC